MAIVPQASGLPRRRIPCTGKGGKQYDIYTDLDATNGVHFYRIQLKD